MLTAGLVLHNFMHARYCNFASGFLIGMSLVFLIAGFVGRQRSLRQATDLSGTSIDGPARISLFS